MEPTRRTVLRLSGVSIVAAVGGCLDDEPGAVEGDGTGGQSAPSSTEDGDGAADEDDDEETEQNADDEDEGTGEEKTEEDEGEDDEEEDQEEDNEEEDQEEDNEEEDDETDPALQLIEPTDSVLDELDWFATEHATLLEEFKRAVGTLQETIEAIQAQDTIEPDDLETIEAAASELDDAAAALRPQLPKTRRVERTNRNHLEELSRYVEVGDQSNAATVLEDYERAVSSLVSPAFFEDLTAPPIQNRAVDWLAAGDDAGDNTLFELRAPGEEPFAAFAYTESAFESAGEPILRGEPARTPAGSALSSTDSDITDRFGPVSTAAGRTDRLYVVCSDWSDGSGDSYFTTELDSSPVFVQRFESEDAATTAAEDLLSSTLTEIDQGTPELGAAQWRHVAYDQGGSVVYAAMKQVGPYLFVTAPGETPIDVRGDEWNDTLERTWLRVTEE